MSDTIHNPIYIYAHWIRCLTFNLLPLIIWSEACVGFSLLADEAYGCSICGPIYGQDLPARLLRSWAKAHISHWQNLIEPLSMCSRWTPAFVQVKNLTHWIRFDCYFEVRVLHIDRCVMLNETIDSTFKVTSTSPVSLCIAVVKLWVGHFRPRLREPFLCDRNYKSLKCIIMILMQQYYLASMCQIVYHHSFIQHTQNNSSFILVQVLELHFETLMQDVLSLMF